MSRTDLAPRWAPASVVVAVLVGVKLVVTAWNGVVFDGQTYDTLHHARRAADGGLKISAMAYDAPTYYLPALLYKELMQDRWRAAASARARERKAAAQSERAREEERKRGTKKSSGREATAETGDDATYSKQRRNVESTARSPFLEFLRWTNIFYVGAFYLLWIYGVLPRVLPDWNRRLPAALLILALPGYQKLAMMSHPDNLHLLAATLCTLVWVRMPGVVASPEGAAGALVDRAAPPSSGHWKMALVAGLSGLTRPFAAATVAVFTAVNLVHLAISNRYDPALVLRRGLALVMLTAVIAGSWFTWRGVVSGTWREAYREGYIEQFDRGSFDYFQYLTTFHFAELLEVPNRQINRLDEANYRRHGHDPDNRYANSFFTTLYSETWGDHWLYSSGRMGADRKVFAKRVLFVMALPLIPLLALRLARAAAALVREAFHRGPAVVQNPAAVLLMHLVAGAALFAAWQFGSALSPGKHSSIKFIYVAFLYAPAVTLCFVPRVREGCFAPWVAYLTALFVAALPVAAYPKWLW